MSQVSQEKPSESITGNSVTGKSQKMITFKPSSIEEIYQIYDITKIIDLIPLIRMWQH